MISGEFKTKNTTTKALSLIKLSLRTWWRHQMETFSALLAICAGNSPVTVEFPAQRPVTRSFDVFFDLRLNKRFSKQSWGWWIKTPSRPLWRHNDGEYLSVHFWRGFITQCVINVFKDINVSKHVAQQVLNRAIISLLFFQYRGTPTLQPIPAVRNNDSDLWLGLIRIF